MLFIRSHKKDIILIYSWTYQIYQNIQLISQFYSLINMNLEDQRYSPNSFKHYGTKVLQNYYRQQLDNQIMEKEQQKQIQKNKLQNEKRQLKHQMVEQQELEKLKDLSYKNYYQMLMNNQQSNTKNFSSIPDTRQHIKSRHISSSTNQGQSTFTSNDKERQRLMANKKNQYKNDLLQQLKQKEDLKQQVKYKKLQQKRQGQRLMDQAKHYAQIQKNIQFQDKLKYKTELDKIMEAKEMSNHSNNYYRQKTKEKTQSTTYGAQVHNVLSNPLPYTIQNPYILREMMKNGNRGYFAGIATNNLYN